jgi:Flp pilus assembly pilin Flp
MLRFASLMADDRGQDLVEYALLSAFIGLAGMAALNLIAQAIGFTYAAWDTNVNDAWEPPAPSAP